MTRRTDEGAFTRRAMLKAGIAAGAGIACQAMADVPYYGFASAGAALPPALVEAAMAAMARHGAMIWSRDVMAIADFSLPSITPRLHLIDLLAGRTTSLLVAHGKGSDPDHTGFLQSFSNAMGSGATSQGAYLTGARYEGVHGDSRRLIGLDPTDSEAEARAIVIHSAWYVGPQIAAVQSKLGRSDGCFAVSPADIAFLLARLGQGRLLYAGKG